MNQKLIARVAGLVTGLVVATAAIGVTSAATPAEPHASTAITSAAVSPGYTCPPGKTCRDSSWGG